MRGKSLRVRFAIWTAGLLFVGMALLSLLVYLILSAELHASLDSSLHILASQTISTIAFNNGRVQVNLDFADFAEGTTAVHVFERDLTIQVLDTQGQEIAAFGPYRTIPVSTEALAGVLNGKTFLDTIVDPATQSPVRFILVPVDENGQRVGSVRVAQNLAGIEATLNRLRIAFLLAIPLMMLFAAAAGYYLAYQALKPIDQITRTARHISAQQLSARLNLPKTKDEVGRLAATFDEMLARLDESFRRERRFVADASHELRTPLTAMQTILSVTLEKPRSDTDYRQALQDLRQVTARLNHLVQNLLLLARSDRQQPSPKNRVDLSLLLRNVADSFRPVAEAKRLWLSCDVPDGLTMLGDEDSLIRLFINLIDNAVKNTQQGGVTIQGECSPDGRTLTIAVADTGCGISAEHLPHIFERFYRVDPSRSAPGTGLGLAIAQDIVGLHRGEIHVESQVGAGTRFTLRLAASS